jgi:hypothetical protein
MPREGARRPDLDQSNGSTAAHHASVQPPQLPLAFLNLLLYRIEHALPE